MRKLRKVRNIFRYNLLTLASAYWQLTKWDRIIKTQTYEEWKHHLSTPVPTQVGTPNPVIPAKAGTPKNNLSTLSKHITTAARNHPLKMNCMRRCLALKTLIENQNGHCQLHIGVKINEQGQLKAHSWLSANGELLNDSIEEISQYKEITHNNTLFAKAAQQT